MVATFIDYIINTGAVAVKLLFIASRHQIFKNIRVAVAAQHQFF
jgi:hypothetical protein